jgi:hypothetical protein
MKLLRASSKTAFLIAGFAVFYATLVFALGSIEFKGCTLLELLTGNRLETGGSGQSLLRFRELEKLHAIDVLLIGSSHAYRSFDPRVFQARGYSSFVMGSPSLTPMNAYFLLKEYLPRIKPRLLVLELSPEILSRDGYECTLDLLANRPLSRRLIEMSLATGNPHAVTLCLLKIIRDCRHPLAEYKQKNVPDENYVSGGYLETGRVRGENRRDEAYEIKVLGFQLRYLSKIIQMAKTWNIPVAGVIQPLPGDRLRSFSNYQAVVDDLRHIASGHEAVILDFSGMTGLDPLLDYRDMDHLNKSGVFKFNNALLDRLAAIKALP